MRLFTGIDISAEVRENLLRTLAPLRSAADVRWTAPEKLHITTKFIGEWPEPRLEEMKRALTGVPKAGSISISLRGLSWFLTSHSSIFLAHVHADSLRQSAQAVQEAVAAIGVPVEERPYSPHLTLARIKDRKKAAALGRASESLKETDFGRFEATEFFLYLSADGTYTKLAAFSLTQP